MCSRNYKSLPEPPATTRFLQLRTNGYFGYDDPLMYPQPVTPGNEHLACIERGGGESDDFIRFWRRALEERDYQELVQSPGTFRISQHLALRLAHNLTYLWRRSGICGKHAEDESARRRVPEMEVATRKVVTKLYRARGSRTIIEYLWVQAVRHALELSAFADYHLEFHHLLRKPRYNFTDRERMGGILRDEDMADRFTHCEIPAYILRDMRSPALFESKMREAVQPRQSKMVTEVSPIYSDVMLECDAWSPDYLKTLREWSQRIPIAAPSPQIIGKKRKRSPDEPEGDDIKAAKLCKS